MQLFFKDLCYCTGAWIFIKLYNIYVDSLQRRPWNRLCEVSVTCAVSCMLFMSLHIFVIQNVLFVCSPILVVDCNRCLSIMCSFCLFESRSTKCRSLHITQSETFSMLTYLIIYFRFWGSLCFIIESLLWCASVYLYPPLITIELVDRS